MSATTASTTGDATIAALAIHPGVPGSLHARRIRRPTVADVGDGRGVLVRVLRVGVDGTDREIITGEYGEAPAGDDFLVTGHENLGQVIEVGPNVPTTIRPGGLVVSTVRRPGTSIYDQIGMQDFTTDERVYERGITRLHGYLAEVYVEDARFVVPLPALLARVGVLLEPTTVAEKGINQAFEIQRRLRVWRPAVAAVIGAGSIGLLATMILRLRGIEVVVYSRREPPYLNSELVEALGARYVNSGAASLADTAASAGPFDLILEASGFGPLAFQAADALGRNGVLVLASVTGGSRTVEIDANRINEGFVLGNKVMVGTVNASRDDFDRGVVDLVRAEATYPGWLERLLTTRVDGLDQPEAVVAHLTGDSEAIKVFVEIAQPEPAG